MAAPGVTTVAISLEISSDGGATFSVPATTVTGHIGAGVPVGTGRVLVWNAGVDWGNQFSTQVRFRITANDGGPVITNITSAAPSGAAGSPIQLTFTVLASVNQNVLLGASLIAGNGTKYPIGIGFPRSLTVGSANYTINGNTAANTPDGTYQLRGGLWVDDNNNGTIESENGDTLIGSAVNFGTYTVDSGTAPAGFVQIPGGAYSIGDNLDGGDPPVQTVTVSAFYLQSKETTIDEWNTVKTWALANGYTFTNAGTGKAAGYPVHSVSWFDVVKWCNARSEKEGLVPCYYTDIAQTVVYKTGDVDITNAMVKSSANGYRLPTDAEWEIGARGGLSGKRFPWGDTINQTLANYYSTPVSYNTSPNFQYHPTYNDGTNLYTSPVASFAVNGGLYDMAGNVMEWCGVYIFGYEKIVRGGSWASSAVALRCAHRGSRPPALFGSDTGFRTARGAL